MGQLQFSDPFRVFFRNLPENLEFPFQESHQTIKHLIELAGVPHTEVGRISLMGAEVDFNYRPLQGDSLQVDILEGPVDVTKTTKLRPEAFLDIRFIVDECVASLAPQLRMLGWDTLLDRKWHDPEIARISAEEKRIVLTRDRGLLMRKEVVWGRFIRSTDPEEQLSEVMQFFAIGKLENALKRCLVCNGILEPVDKKEIEHLLGPKTKQFFHDFSRCSNCGKIYWEGSHFSRMQEKLSQL